MSDLNEFGVIQTFFKSAAPEGYIGVGDDCAVFPVRPGFQLAVSTDTLIEGQHFFTGADPATIGHKALAVGLSDLAAMGAKPTGCVLALALPSVNEVWLKAFSAEFIALASKARCPLLGGDTTRNPNGIVITVTVFGEVPIAHALRRDLALPNDDIWLTGTLGAPHLALNYLSGKVVVDEARLAQSRPLLERPEPPYAFAPALLEHAHAGIDISDGLLQDLSHLLKASQCGATLQWSKLPVHPALNNVNREVVKKAVLTGGDVFQLCFTAHANERAYLLALAAQENMQLSRIGTITTESDLVVLDENQTPLSLPEQGGFDHFSSEVL